MDWTRTAALPALAAIALVRCGIDGTLLCGDPCADASLDGTLSPDVGADVASVDAGPADARADVQEAGKNDGEAGCPLCNGNPCCAPQTCNQNVCCHLANGSCFQNNSCCSGLVCTAGNQCETSCHDAGGSCQSDNDCCRPTRCSGSNTCQCNAVGVACAQDQDCCSNNCITVDGSQVCGP